MRKFTLFVSLTCLCAAFGAQWQTVRAETLIADMSQNLVAISSSFTGTSILMFGAIDQREDDGSQPDIVVVVRGPENDVTVRKKNRVAGIWMNNESVTFKKIPGYYVVASTRGLHDIASDTLLDRRQIGLTHLRADVVGADPKNEEDARNKSFRTAIFRTKLRDKLYAVKENAVEFLGETLFRLKIDLPANVPVGSYKAEAYLFRDGDIISVQSAPLYVSKVGIERQIYSFAQQQSFYYGIVAVILAVAAGWFASVIFRKG